MAINPKKRSRYVGRRKGMPFLQLHHHIIDSLRFAALKGSALKMLIDLARQYNGKNNGDLSPALLRKSGRWKSEDTMRYALEYLLEHGWIVKTKQGGMGIGCNLYAITWWPIDECNGKHDYPVEQVASNLWAKKTPHRITETKTPDSGASEPSNCSIVDHLTPESGAKTAISKAA
ncbi:hypothetical protein [Dokdonella soli]